MKIRHIEWESGFNGSLLRGMVGNLTAYTIGIRGTSVEAECFIGDDVLFYRLFREKCLNTKFEDICEEHFKQFLLNLVENAEGKGDRE